MEWSAVTLTLFAGVAILFIAGLGLIWVGLRREPNRLPSNADDILDAIVTGRLGPPPGPKSVDHTGEVRLVRRPDPAPTAPSVPEPVATKTTSATRERRTEPEPSAVRVNDDPRRALAEPANDDDLSLTEKLFFADEPQLEKF
jgi:hypothetical protein